MHQICTVDAMWFDMWQDQGGRSTFNTTRAGAPLTWTMLDLIRLDQCFLRATPPVRLPTLAMIRFARKIIS